MEYSCAARLNQVPVRGAVRKGHTGPPPDHPHQLKVPNLTHTKATATAAQTAVSTFNFKGFDLRATVIDREPCFVASDTCKVLGLSNVTRALQNINQIEVMTHCIPGTRGRPNKIINEASLYKIVMRSDKPEAKAFQDWVTRDVLPAIRKDGG